MVLLRIDWSRLVGSIVSFCMGLLAIGVIIALLGHDPIEGYRLLFEGMVSNFDIALQRAALLALSGLSFAIPALAGLFNIGGEGMAYIGGLAALVVGYLVPNPLLALLAGGLAGAAVGFLVGVLRVRRGVHEVVSTVMLNWVLYYLVSYIVVCYLKNPRYPDVSVFILPGSRLPVYAGVILSFTICVLCFFLAYYTRWGVVLRSIGVSADAARAHGVNVDSYMLWSMVVGGFLGGLAGSVLVVCESYCLSVLLSGLYGVGFNGIGVALLAWNNPIAIIPAALLVSSLYAGSYPLQIEMGIDSHVISAIVGVVVFILAIPGLVESLRRARLLRLIVREVESRG